MRASALLLLMLTPSATPAEDPLQRAVEYLGNFAPDSMALNAAYATEAIAQLDIDPKAWPANTSMWARLAPATGGGRYSSMARLAHAAATAGYDPRIVNGHLALDEVEAGWDGAQFGDATRINDDIWALLALHAAGVAASDDRIQRAALAIEAARRADGGWAYQPVGLTGNTDITGMALAALDASGRDVPGDSRARQFLDSTYDAATALHRDNTGQPPNANSAVWALHGYHLLGVAPRSATIAALWGLQEPDGGFRYAPSGADSDAIATTEVVAYLAGGRYPLPGHAPGHVSVGALHALEPATLSVDGNYARVEWTIPGALLDGSRVEFPTKGSYHYKLYATGDAGRWRTGGDLNVLTARPRVAPPSELEALRHVPVALDAGASDADGTVVAYDVRWGDGNASATLEHAYALPGDHTARLRARDDEGAWSDAASVLVHVKNRAPLFVAAPARIVADRAHDVELAPGVEDPEGDAIALRWWTANASGGGPVRVRFATLGNHTLHLEAADGFGGNARIDVAVEVVNLPPLLRNLSFPLAAREGVPFNVSVDALDPDGAEPPVTWRVANSTSLTGARGQLVLPAGEYEILVEATDADGATRKATGRFVVSDDPQAVVNEASAPVDEPRPVAEAASPLPLPRIDAPSEVEVDAETRVLLAETGEAVEFRFEFGDDEAIGWSPAREATHAWPRAGTYELRAFARAADGRTASASRIVHVALPPSAPVVLARASPVVEETQEAPAPHDDPGEADVDAVSSAAPAMQEARREAPLPGWALTVGLLLAALGTRARRGPRSR